MTTKLEWGNNSYLISAHWADPTQEVAVQSLDREVQGRGELFVTMQKLDTLGGVAPVPHELHNLLQKFPHLLEDPKSLPPPREFDHKIALQEGATLVNVQPYRYAYF
ncbi:hypothetical protein AAC387_Pa08g0900 [Persea americana]